MGSLMSAIRSALEELFGDKDQSPSELASGLKNLVARDQNDDSIGSPTRSGLYVFGIRRGGRGNLSPVTRRVGGMEGEME